MSAAKPPPDGVPPDDDEIEESLNEALNDLEQMLTKHRGAVENAPRTEPAAEDGDQYTIPLLDEVVIPGVKVHAAVPPAARGEDPQPAIEDDEPALRRRLAARLASEVEVIVQDRTEAALEVAREEIRERVREHMDIILPEIVEELIQLRRRRAD
jgi:hypothetical protein